jgi:hypothetical protein
MRAVVNVATGNYVRGQERLIEWLSAHNTEYFNWRDRLPGGSPSHQDVPYAFKAYALWHAYGAGAKTLLWADASILPIYPLEPLWERIERDGYWIGNNGWTNYEWTADSAYPALFEKEGPIEGYQLRVGDEYGLAALKRLNRDIPHVVATAFGISMEHPIGRAILDEYFRLASTTKAFCGPWINGPEEAQPPYHAYPCGPPDVRGHRHDQTALSVIAWRLGCKLTNSPEIFAYAGGQTEQTILVADGSY